MSKPVLHVYDTPAKGDAAPKVRCGKLLRDCRPYTVSAERLEESVSFHGDRVEWCEGCVPKEAP